MHVEAARAADRPNVGIAGAPGAVPVSPACFSAAGTPIQWVTPLAVRLPTRHAEALAELLPALLCGEESAALVFDHYAQSAALPPAARRALERIGADEERHAIWLQRLRLGLPEPPKAVRDDLAVRRFYLSIGEREPARHLLRIAALDSAVCVLLGTLRCRHSPVAADEVLARVLARIHRDEARHVAVASRLARQLAGDSDLRGVAIDTRERLARLLERRAAAIERLDTCPDALFRRLRRVPRTLLA